MTTVTGSRFDPAQRPVEPHPFVADSYDPHYRSRCRICGVPQDKHPYFHVPQPRRPA